MLLSGFSWLRAVESARKLRFELAITTQAPYSIGMTDSYGRKGTLSHTAVHVLQLHVMEWEGTLPDRGTGT